MTPPKEPQRLLLEPVDGGLAPAELPRSGVLTVGSSTERADYAVDGQGVADVHCAIGRAKGGGWAVKDLGSEHGTRLNGETVRAARLKAGDELLIGSRRLRVVDPSAPVAEAKAAPEAKRGPAPTTADAGEQATAARGVVPPEVPGYRVVRPLGRGGMGDVFLAVQESLDREVALKVLSHRVEADSEFVRRFQAEARAAAALNHPNVVTVYDVGETRGVHYLSMEYMDAGNLETRVARSGALDARETLRVLRDAASGLVYAETKGIVHRDIKPANLMQNQAGTTKIADLGLATHVDAEEAPEGRKVFGTPHFMSPEQARGERLDGRSDLYSLGATVYRLLSGRTPFEGKSSREILRAHLRDEATPLEELVPGVPSALAELVTRLMRKEPAERLASASELVREVERIEATLAGGATVAAAGAAGSGGRRAALVLVPLVLVAVGAGAWLLTKGDGGTTRAGEPLDDPALVARGLPDGDAGPGAPELPAPPPLPVATTSRPEPDGAEDTALKLREAEARVAFLELDSRELSRAERRDELRTIAAKYLGTTAATDALARADELDAAIRTAAAELQDVDQRRKELLDRVRAAVHAVAGPSPAARLRAFDAALVEAGLAPDAPDTPEEGVDGGAAGDGAVPDPSGGLSGGLADDPALQAGLAAIQQGIVDAALEHARGTLERLETKCQQGDFDAVVPELDALAPTFELPDDAAGRGLAGLARLDALRARAAELRGSLDELRATWSRERAEEDALALASAVHGDASSTRRTVEAQIAALDFASAARTLRDAAATLNGPETHAFAVELAEDAERANDVLRTLAAAFEGGGWRRTMVTDPRERGRAARDAVGADAEGLLLDVGGDVVKVPWSAYGADTKELHRLFNDRLERAWTPDERAAIATLLRLTAVCETLAVVRPMLEPGARRSILQREVDAVDEAFAEARGWSEGEERERLDRERAAAALLVETLRNAFDERWSEAASGARHLLTSFRDTLLVRALSDGTGSAIRPPAPFVDLPKTRKPDEAASESSSESSEESSDGPPDRDAHANDDDDRSSR